MSRFLSPKYVSNLGNYLLKQNTQSRRTRAFTDKPTIKKKNKRSLEQTLYSLEEIVEDTDT